MKSASYSYQPYKLSLHLSTFNISSIIYYFIDEISFEAIAAIVLQGAKS